MPCNVSSGRPIHPVSSTRATAWAGELAACRHGVVRGHRDLGEHRGPHHVAHRFDKEGPLPAVPGPLAAARGRPGLPPPGVASAGFLGPPAAVSEPFSSRAAWRLGAWGAGLPQQPMGCTGRPSGPRVWQGRPFTPRKVARFSAEGHQRGIAMPAQGNSRVGTYMGIGNASTAGIPSFSATCWPTTT